MYIDERLDPNYIIRSQFKDSAFHCSLHEWMRKNEGRPLLHIDIHGRTDKYVDNSDIEFGVMPLRVYFGDEFGKETLIEPLV